MAKRRGEKDKIKKQKKRLDDDLFEVKVSEITDNKFETDLVYHIRTNRCPYNKQDCSPENSPYGEGGIENCPIHQGESIKGMIVHG